MMISPVRNRQHRPRPSSTAVAAAAFVLLIALSGSAACALAQGVAAQSTSAPSLAPQGTPGPTPPKGNPVAKPASAKSAWKDLTAEQQQALKPLAAHWNSLTVERRRKWLVVSKNFPKLPPAEQAKLHSRMSEWASLSDQQRNQARLNFAETKQLSAEEKAKKWQAYQALSPEEKKKLAAKAPPKRAGVAIVKPAPAHNLANVPVTRLSQARGSRLAAAKHPIDENTLLPQPPVPPAEADPVQAQSIE
jgi:hypothetical protein